MDDYPTLDVERATDPQWKDGRQADRDGNGDLHTGTLWAAPKREFPLKHPALDATQKAALWAFYLAHRGTEAAFVYTHAMHTDGVGVTVCFDVAPPQFKWVRPGRWDVAVKLLER